MKKRLLTIGAAASFGFLAFCLLSDVLTSDGADDAALDGEAPDEQEEPQSFKIPSGLVALGVKLLPVAVAIGHKRVDDLDAAAVAVLGNHPVPPSADDTAPTE